MRKLLLAFLIVLPFVVIAQNKKGKQSKVIEKVVKTDDGEEVLVRIYPNHVTVIGGGEYTAPKEEPKAKTEKKKTVEKPAFKGLYRTGNITSDCKCKGQGKVLKGKVKVVDCSPDYKVMIVNESADLRIKVVDFPSGICGEWQFVDCGQDFTIQFVDVAPDFTIQFDNYNPGRQ